MTTLGRIRDYELERVIARGGMATVYQATDTRSGRRVALKQILPQVAHDPEFIERFRHEVRIHAALHHPNILEVHELEAGPEHYFIAMELAEGGALKALLERHAGAFVPEVALFVASQMLRGLQAAHDSGIIHRDIKPHNVLLTGSGALKVADFGISKTDQMTRLTQTGDLIGTPAYMSPEQASLAKLDARTDLFSVGVVLYEMLAGRNPFNTGNPVTTLRMIADHHPAPLFDVDPRIPVACEVMADRLLAKDRERRFATAAAAADAADSLLAQLGSRDPRTLFAHFLRDPAGVAREVRRRQSAGHLRMGKGLLESGRASPEVVLWSLYQAAVLDPENAEAKVLVAEQTGRTGYSLELGTPAPKAEELARKLQDDPDNVSLLLQLAKSHKVQRCFLRLMRCFFRLRGLRIADPYLQGQVAALVARADATQPPQRQDAAVPRPPAAPPRAAPPAAVTRPAAAPEGDPAVTVRATPPEPASGPPRPVAAPRRPAPARPAAAAPARPPIAPQGSDLSQMPLPFKVGFGLAGLLVLAGVLKLLFG